MTWEEYYEALKKKWEEVDKNDLGAIHRYNEWMSGNVSYGN